MNGNILLILNLSLILILYAAKALMLRRIRTPTLTAGMFALIVALCVPITWALSPDWNNRTVARVTIYVGWPVALLTVPCVSFLLDLIGRVRGHPWRISWRMLLEIVVGVPLWLFVWLYVEVMLGWAFI